MATYTEQLQRIVRSYLDDGQPWPATTRQIAAWAIRRGEWQPQPFALINQCADQLARAMREEHFTDTNGRVIRAKHVARIERGGSKSLFGRTSVQHHVNICRSPSSSGDSK